MLYDFLLFAHVGGACVTGVAALYTGVVLWQGTASLYRTCALVLGGLAVLQILSGVALAIISIAISAQSLCTDVGLYLAVLLFIETSLFVRMKKISMPFPLAQILSPIAISLLLMGAVVAYGF